MQPIDTTPAQTRRPQLTMSGDGGLHAITWVKVGGAERLVAVAQSSMQVRCCCPPPHLPSYLSRLLGAVSPSLWEHLAKADSTPPRPPARRRSADTTRPRLTGQVWTVDGALLTLCWALPPPPAGFPATKSHYASAVAAVGVAVAIH